MIEDDDLSTTAGADALATDKPSEATAAPETEPAKAEKDTPETGEKPETDDDAGEGAGRTRKPGSQRKSEQIGALKARLAELEAKLAGQGEAQNKPPKLTDFDDYDAYETAKVEWAAGRAVEKMNAKQGTSEAEGLRAELVETLVSAHATRVREASERIPDFSMVMTKAQNVPVNTGVQEAILESDKSALLLYHLASRPEEVAALNRMDARSMARRIGQIEARLSYPSPRTETKAPPPVSGLKGGSSPNGFDPDSASHEDFKRLFARTR